MIGIWLVAVSVFALYTATFGIMQPRIQRGVHLLFLLPMAFILFPATKKSISDKIPVYDWILAFLALLPALYVIIHNDALSMRFEFVDPLTSLEMVLGALNILLLLEAIRRAVVPAMTILIVAFIAYLYAAPYLSGVFYAKPLPLSELIEMQYLITDAGIYGSITGISATFVALMVIFGAIMEGTQTGKFFTDLACRLAGKSRGGPAKVAVISSAFFGSISGVAAANVYATGTFTIPMMKRLGYRPQFAGAVEAVSSSGGQYMPPIMGAGAFVMSEITGIPYLEICIAAALPALIYYASLVIRVHFVALQDNLKGLTEEEMMVPLSVIIKDAYLLIPLVGLVAMLVVGYSVFMAAMGAIAISFVISFFKKKTAMTPKRLLEALRAAGQNMVMIALACAGAGMVVAIVTHTGLALGIATVITNWSGGYLQPALMLIMVTSLVLGMGMPCTPAYIVAITIGGPALVALGIDLLASHLFVFYFAILAEVTPPVCIPAYCAASIAGVQAAADRVRGLQAGPGRIRDPLYLHLQPSPAAEGGPGRDSFAGSCNAHCHHFLFRGVERFLLQESYMDLSGYHGGGRLRANICVYTAGRSRSADYTGCGDLEFGGLPAIYRCPVAQNETYGSGTSITIVA